MSSCMLVIIFSLKFFLFNGRKRQILQKKSKTLKKEKMFEHRITCPEYNGEGNHIGWSHVTLKDHNGCLNPEFSYQEMIQLVEDITPHFRAGDNVDEAAARDPNTPIGLFVPQDQLPAINEMLEQGGFKLHAPNNVRNILAITANTSTTILPDLNQINLTINIICDYT